MLKESQGNGMAKIKKLRHHMLVMATCLAMMLASSCFVASATDEDVSANGAANNESVSTEESTDVASNQNEDATENSQDNSAVYSNATDQVADDHSTDRAAQARGATYDVTDDELSAPAVSGTWKSESGGWRFYNSAGVMQKGLFTIDGKKYYLGPDGAMKTGWQQIGSHYYYFGSDGSMRTGWLSAGSTWYYLHSDGSMAFGLEEVEKLLYFFGASNDGAMKTGWHKISDAYYYFGSSGAAAKGWQKIGGYWYYFDKMGFMLTGNQVLDGKSYYLGAANDGAMKTGWQVVGATYESNKKIADRWGYYGADGAALKNNWLKYGGYWYYFDADGVMQTDVAEIGGKYYYFGTENDGRMKTGWQKIDDTWAYLGADGAARTGWQKIGNYWYYLGEYGEMETDLRNIDGSLYYLGSDGAMRTGWQQVSGDWYYFNASGAAITRWEQINGVWYYFKSNYKMVKDTILNIDGREFAFHAWGGMIIGSVHVNGKTYYTDEFGAIIAEYVPSTVVDYGLQFLGENGTRFNDWYYRNATYRTWAWCNTFVSYVMYNCGISFKKTAYVPDAEQWMQSHYDWVSVNEAKSGDIIIFCWTGEGNNSGKGDRDHIGFLISKNKDGSFTTLEGNTSGNKVAIRTRYIKNIRNIFRPRY